MSKRKHVVTVALEEDGHYWVRCTCTKLSIDGPLDKYDALRSKRDHEKRSAPPSRFEPEFVPGYWNEPLPSACSFCGLTGHTKISCEIKPLAAI